MNIIKLIHLLFQLTFFCAVKSNLILPKLDNKSFPILSNITKYILKTCNEDYKTILISGISEGIMNQSIGSIENVLPVLFNQQLRIVRNYLLPQTRTKINSFILTINETVDELDTILKKLKSSFWWNIASPYFVLSGSKNGCSDAQRALLKIWKWNILNCYFVCLDSDQNPFIYTFNPYSNRAPYEWKIVQEIQTKSQYLVIYNRPYKEENICDGFNFDRTKHLDKTTINIITPGNYLKSYTYNLIVKEAVRNAFNVSITPKNSLRCDVGKISHELNLIQREVPEIAVCLGRFTKLPGSKSYPINTYSFYGLTNNLSELTTTNKVQIHFDVFIVLLLLLTTVIIYSIILLTNSSQNYSFIVLQIVRLWTRIPLNMNINFSGIRLLFCSIFIFFMILQAVFNGQYIKWLIFFESSTNPVSIEDLCSDTYKKILIPRDVWVIGDNFKNIGKKWKKLHDLECIDKVLENKSNVCIVDFLTLPLQLQLKNLTDDNLKNLHLSKYPISNDTFVYSLRKDWPLKEWFDKSLMSLESYGIIEKIVTNATSQIVSYSQKSQVFINFQPLSLDSLSFAFYFWMVGMISSFVCFIFETCIRKTLIIEYGKNW